MNYNYQDYYFQRIYSLKIDNEGDIMIFRQPETTIGRDIKNDYTFDHPYCSHKHCMIVFRDSKKVLVKVSNEKFDYQEIPSKIMLYNDSPRFTFVNGEPVEKGKWKELKENDIIAFGVSYNKVKNLRFFDGYFYKLKKHKSVANNSSEKLKPKCDFISMLPNEVASRILLYLEAPDLGKASRVCRTWYFLANDNILWKEKCSEVGITSVSSSSQPKSIRNRKMLKISPWKEAYMRHYLKMKAIEVSWRYDPIRTPRIIYGHAGHVIRCIEFDGDRIVTGSHNHYVKIWSAMTGEYVRTLYGHTNSIWCLQMSGNIIISGSADTTLKVWDAETGNCKHTLVGHTGIVRCVHLYGNIVVSGSRDATIRVWDINDGKCLYELTGHSAAVRCVQYDGKVIISSSYDHLIKIWDFESQECLHTLHGHTSHVYSLKYNGLYIVSGSLDASICVWNVRTGELCHILTGHTSPIYTMELKGHILVSSYEDYTAKIWNIITGKCLATLGGRNKHTSAITSIQTNSNFVITSSYDGTVKLWDIKTGEFIRNLVGHIRNGRGNPISFIRANDMKLVCAVGSFNTSDLKILSFDRIRHHKLRENLDKDYSMNYYEIERFKRL